MLSGKCEMTTGAWLYIDDYAKLRCHRKKTLKSYCEEGMPHYIDGNRTSVDPDEADLWLKQNKRRGGDNRIELKPLMDENAAVENILRRKN